MQLWPPNVQDREQFLYHTVGHDTFIFRNRADGIYFAIGGIDKLGVETILMVADVVKYTSQRLKDIYYDPKMGYFRK